MFGAARYSLTAALFEVPADLCVGFPGEPAGLTSSVRPLAIAVSATREGAERFVSER